MLHVLKCWHSEGSSVGGVLTLLQGAVCDWEHHNADRLSPSLLPWGNGMDNLEELLFLRKRVQRLCLCSSLK